MTKFLPTLLSASMVRGSHGVGSCTTLKGQSSFRPVMSSRHGHSELTKRLTQALTAEALSGRRIGLRGDYDRAVAAWLAWALVAVLLAIGEILTPGLFFLGPIAVAAVAAAVAAASARGGRSTSRSSSSARLPRSACCARSPAATSACLSRCAPERPRSWADAVVLERVDVNGGRVKIGGEVWSARAFDESRCSSPGRGFRSPKSRARQRSSTDRSPHG